MLQFASGLAPRAEKMTGPSDHVIDTYRQNAQLWLSRRSQEGMEEKWLRAFADLLPDQAQVLDVGCGSGDPMARWLLTQGFEVTGIDSAPELISVAQAALPDATWITADMRKIDLDQTFEGLLAWHSLFHLSPEDQRVMFPIFSRYMRIGAALMFTSGPDAGERIGELGGAPLYHASLSSEEYRDLLAETGFEVIDHVVDDPDCGGATVWLARKSS